MIEPYNAVGLIPTFWGIRKRADIKIEVVTHGQAIDGFWGVVRNGVKAARGAWIARPVSVRTGMFCRFGLMLERRPVAATAWLKTVCTRPLFFSTSLGRISM